MQLLNKRHIWLLLLSVSLSLGAANSQSSYTQKKRDRDARLIDQCSLSSKGVDKVDGAICFHGSINEDNAYKLSELINAFPDDTLIINSAGGRADLAIDIGRTMHRNETRLIVNQLCHSSCANYLVPAAFKLVVWEDSFIMMHGSLPREFFGYYDIFQTATPQKEGDAASDNFNELYDKYPEFIKTEVVEETKFFADIRQTEQYVHRYWEVLRNLRLYGAEKCQAKTGFNLVLGPKYLSEFVLTNHDYIWWPSRAEVLEKAVKRRGGSVLTLDTDLMPSWVPDIGAMKRADCLKPRAG